MISIEARCFYELGEFFRRWDVVMEPHQNDRNLLWIKSPNIQSVDVIIPRLDSIYCTSLAVALAVYGANNGILKGTEQLKKEVALFTELGSIYDRYNLYSDSLAQDDGSGRIFYAWVAMVGPPPEAAADHYWKFKQINSQVCLDIAWELEPIYTSKLMNLNSAAKEASHDTLGVTAVP